MVASLSYIPPKCAKIRETEDKHCVSWYTYIGYYICVPVCLDSPKNLIALPYIIWGLIQDVKNKIERSQLTNFSRLPSGISKIRERKEGKFPCKQATDR